MDSMNTVFDVIYNEINNNILNKVVVYEFNVDLVDDVFDSSFKNIDIGDIYYDMQRYMNINVIQHWVVDDVLVVIIRNEAVNND